MKLVVEYTDPDSGVIYHNAEAIFDDDVGMYFVSYQYCTGLTYFRQAKYMTHQKFVSPSCVKVIKDKYAE